MDFDVKFWAGTEESLALYLASLRALAEGKLEQPQSRYTEDEGERRSRLLSKHGDIGIIRIAGPLNNTDSWINEYRGMTGYPEIREALVQAASDASIMGIILDINSGGGQVSGVFDTAKLIQRVDKIKPVHTFSDGTIASAAYLLGSAARTVTIGRMTEAGSIGVVQVHQEVSKMLEEIGIKATVMRAGKFKALGNPFEPLSDEARAEMQQQLDDMYRVFVEHVADRRKVSYEVADKKMAQGRVFVGDRAEAVGLVDAVATFDEVASKLQGGIDAKKPGSKYAPNFTQGNKLVAEKKPLTEQDVAALALGAGAAGATTPDNDNGAGEGAGATPSAEEIAAKEAADKKAAEDAAAAATADKKAAPEQKSESEIVAFLRAELSARDEKIVSMTVELNGLKAAAEAGATTHKAFRGIAEMSVSRLRVALGSSGAKVEDMTDAALLSEQASLEDAFNKKFKAGGVASVSTEQKPEKKGESVPSSVRQARLKATRPQ